MKNNLKIIFATTFLIFKFQLSITYAQVSINESGASPDASAILDVSSTDKGFLAPRMTESEREAINSPAEGLMVYQTDNREGIYIYKSFGWVQVI